MLDLARTLAANGPIVSGVFCERGWGRSNLWPDEGADRWGSFIRKKLELNTKSHFAVFGTKGFPVLTNRPDYFADWVWMSRSLVRVFHRREVHRPRITWQAPRFARKAPAHLL